VVAKMNNNSKVPQIRFKGFTEDWEQRKLGDVVQITMGQSPDGATYSDAPSDYILVQGNADLEDGWVKPRIWTTQKTKYATTGDLIMSVRAPAGTMGKTAYNVVLGRGVAAIKGNEFIFQTLTKMDYEGFWKKLSAGSTFESLNSNVIFCAEINLPKKQEQDKIGSLFGNLDNLITLYQRKYGKLVNMKKALLEKMFPQAGETVPAIRFKGFTDAWEQRKLGEIATEINRNDPESNAPIMMITANNGFIEQSERYAFNNAGESLKKYILLEKGELAYNHGASKLRPYGSCFSLATSENARIPFVYHCFSVAGNNPEFVSTELNGSNIEKQLRRIVSSGARMDGLLNISFDEYSTVELMLPSVPEQESISEYFRNLDNLITLHQRKLEKLKNIKSALLEKMFVS
jgi:type I restriction enzyme S subunit